MKPIDKLKQAVLDYQNETQELIRQINVENLCVQKSKTDEYFSTYLVNLVIETNSVE